MPNITISDDDRRRERKDAAHHQVLDRVGVDVDAVDGVAGARGDVVVEPERLQVLEQPVRAGRRPSAGRYRPAPACRRPRRTGWRPAAARRRRRRRPAARTGCRREPPRSQPANGSRKRLPLEHVVDDDRERPRLQRAEADLGQQQHRRAARRASRYGRRNDSVQRSRPSIGALGRARRSSAHLARRQRPAAAAPGSARSSG